MSYGTGGDSKPTTFFRVEGLKRAAKELYFKGSAKAEGETKYTEIPVKPTYIEGVVTGVKTDSFVHEGDTIHKVVITLDDVTDRCVLEMNVASNMASSLINTLAGSEGISNLKLSLYTSKTGHASMFIEADSGMTDVKWAWDYKKVIAPLIETATLGGKTLTDKSKLVAFLVGEINKPEFQKKYGTAVVASPEPVMETTEEVRNIEVDTGDKQAPVEEIEDDDLPF